MDAASGAASSVGAAGLMVLISRGGGSGALVGFGASAGRAGPDGRFPLSFGASLKSCAVGGRVIFR